MEQANRKVNCEKDLMLELGALRHTCLAALLTLSLFSLPSWSEPKSLSTMKQKFFN